MPKPDLWREGKSKVKVALKLTFNKLEKLGVSNLIARREKL